MPVNVWMVACTRRPRAYYIIYLSQNEWHLRHDNEVLLQNLSKLGLFLEAMRKILSPPVLISMTSVRRWQKVNSAIWKYWNSSFISTFSQRVCTPSVDTDPSTHNINIFSRTFVDIKKENILPDRNPTNFDWERSSLKTKLIYYSNRTLITNTVSLSVF